MSDHGLEHGPQHQGSQSRLNVIGLGVKIPEHTTAQAIAAMVECSRIFSIVQEPPALWLPSPMPRAVPVKNILEMYVEGALRSENYDRVADMILQSVREDQTIGYVTYGNPLAYDSVAQKLVHSAREAGIPFEVVPGISSIDTLLCDLGADMAPGIQVYEASWLVAAEIRPEVSVAVILLQIGTFGSLRAHYSRRPEANSLADLEEYLGQFYPSTQDMFLIRSSGGAPYASNIRRVALSGLCQVPTEDLLNCSMYIPPFAPAHLNQQVLAAMREA